MSVFTHSLSTNNYGPAKFIVDASAANGTHTTIAAALTSASSGDTIFIRPGTYTENLTLKAGVNLTAYSCDSITPNVTISGTCTFTAAGTVTINGIRLQTNSAALLAITGSAASIVFLTNCYLNCTNSTGITYSTANTSAKLTINNCTGDVGTTGIGLFTHTSTGQFVINYSNFTNSGASTTASTCGTGSNTNCFYSSFAFPFSCSSTGNLFFQYCNINTLNQNVTCFTTAGTGTSVIEYSDFISGTASALSIGSGTTIDCYGACRIESSNTNAITGAGTFNFTDVAYTGSSSLSNVTTPAPYRSTKGMELIQTQTASNVASLSFTKGFGRFNAFFCVYRGVQPATNAAILGVQISNDGGSTYQNASYASGVTTNANNSTTLANTNSTTTIKLSGATANSGGGGTGASGHFYLYNDSATVSGQVAYLDSTSAAWSNGQIIAGLPVTGTNALQFSFSSGNISTGTISIYGINT